MFKGNYSCNRAVIFEVAVFLLLLLFWTNRISTTTTTPASQQTTPSSPLYPQPPTSPHHLLHPTNHQSPSPQQPQPPAPQPHFNDHTTTSTTTPQTSPHQITSLPWILIKKVNKGNGRKTRCPRGVRAEPQLQREKFR